MKSGAFRDQVVIVTGASAGIGKAVALALASQGAKVVVAARREDRLQRVAEDCRKAGSEALVVATDVADESQCRSLVERTVATFGRLDMLVNNAGFAASSLFDEFPTLELFKKTVDVNFYGAVHCTYCALPELKKQRGRIVAVSSLGGKAALPYNTPYCSSKFALHGFYESLRMELASSRVSCTMVCPGWVATEFHEAQMDKNGVPRGARGRAYYTQRTMTSERCAQIILEAALKRRREVLMGPRALTLWTKLLSPGLLDWLTIKVFLEPAIRRAQSASRRSPT